MTDTPASRPAPAPPASPASIAATITAMLAGYGITRTYITAAPGIAVISVSPGLTAWTDGRQLWWNHGTDRETWPAASTRAAAARLAALSRATAP